jgi:WD40 repeat protein
MRFLITGSFLFLISFNLVSQNNFDCFNRFYNEGIKLYNENKFDEASAQFKAAKICDHLPENNDIDLWLTKALEGAKKTREVSEQEKKKAENDLKNAKESLNKAKQQEHLSEAQKMALNSVQKTNDTMTRVLMALQSFLINKENGGTSNDPVICDALRKAYLLLNSTGNLVTPTSRQPRALCEKNNIIYYADIEGLVQGWDLDRSAVSFSKTIKSKSPVRSVFFYPDGTRLIAGCENNTIIIVDLSSGEKTELTGHHGEIRSVAFTNNGKQFATAGKDSTIILWNIESGSIAKAKTIRAVSAIKALVFLSSGDTLVSADENGNVIAWNLNTSEGRFLYKSNNVGASSLAFNRPGNSLLAGFRDGSLILLNLDFIKDTAGIIPGENKPHTAGIDAILFNKDYSIVATAGADKMIKISDFDDYYYNQKQNPIEIQYQDVKIKNIIFTDNDKLIIGCSDNTIRLEEITSDRIADKICALLKTGFEKSIKVMRTQIPKDFTKEDLQKTALRYMINHYFPCIDTIK